MRTSERPFVILRRVGEIGVGGEGGMVSFRDGVRKWESERGIGGTGTGWCEFALHFVDT
jgi:hypothetical protein